MADMKTWVDNKMRYIIGSCGTNKIVGWVEPHGGKANFRRHVATTLVYKGKRKAEKPSLLNEAKDYIVDQYNFRWSNWVESEDWVLIAGKKLGWENVIVAGIDKDLLQVPALFFNYNAKWKQNGEAFMQLSEDEAEYNLYAQFLTGDMTDNIPGLWKVGPVAAAKTLACDRSKWPLAVAMEYIKRGHGYSYLLEQCRLLYLIREMNEVYHYPLSREEYEQLAEEHEDV